MLQFRLPDSAGTVAVTDNVLRHLGKCRQIPLYARERGGQLFCRFNGSEAVVERATGPRKRDRRGLSFLYPDRGAEQEEIYRLYQCELHYIGDWHTHAESIPSPSDSDLLTMSELFARSQHELAGFILIIVGQAAFPQGLHVSLHSMMGAEQLLPV